MVKRKMRVRQNLLKCLPYFGLASSQFLSMQSCWVVLCKLKTFILLRVTLKHINYHQRFIYLRSFCQTICVLGYCILPLVTGLVLNAIIKLFSPVKTWILLIRLAIVIAGLAYSIFSSATFVAPSARPGRVALVVYPLCLFYFFIGWLVFVNTGSSQF